MKRVMPSPEEYASLAPSPGSPVWRAAADLRLFAGAGYATLLQVCHPTVGAGVYDYSSFTKDPWGRLFRTLDYVNGTIYGGPRMAGEIGSRVREVHKTIKGVKPDGSKYHAMERDAFAWVHATLAAAVVQGHAHFIRPMTWDEKERYWAEWRGVGRLVGVRLEDLPLSWREFGPYFDSTIDGLEDGPAVHQVLDLLEKPTVPNFLAVPPRVWRLANKPASIQLRLATLGLMPARLRERIGVKWTRRDELGYRALGAASRAAGPLLPRSFREFGPLYVKMRRKQLERGDVASRSPAQRELAAA